MNYIDLFSGIGGFALGAYNAGFKCENHFFSEINQYCIDLYKKRFKDSICLGDITKINTKELKKYGNEWIITGGFPCQDISQAGRKKGIEGERSILWFEYWRVIRDLQPRFAIIENVPMLTIRGLDRVLSSLAEIGYNAEWQTISAKQIGAIHKRERIWIIAYPESFRRDEIKYEIKMGELCKSIIEKQKDWFKLFYVSSGNNQFIFSKEIESLFCRNDDGFPSDVDRLTGLGNSIIPQIAQLLFYRVIEILKENK